MADLAPALDALFAHEGAYSADPLDPGGETYRGVARRRWPQWIGWHRVDNLRSHENFPRVLQSDAKLAADVRDFYRREFWDRLSGDQIRSQAVATELLDQAVNFGLAIAVLHLQQALNALNRNATSWPDVIEDGDCGPRTVAAMSACLANPADEGPLLVALSNLQGARYIELARRNPKLERFLRGWLKRSA